jgi:hypothetical protein
MKLKARTINAYSSAKNKPVPKNISVNDSNCKVSVKRQYKYRIDIVNDNTTNITEITLDLNIFKMMKAKIVKHMNNNCDRASNLADTTTTSGMHAINIKGHTQKGVENDPRRARLSLEFILAHAPERKILDLCKHKAPANTEPRLDTPLPCNYYIWLLAL